MENTVKITPLDGLTRFLVQSDVNPDAEYLVDLEAFHGNSGCSCPHFEFRLQPQLMLGKKAPASEPNIYRCRHIMACRELLGNELVNTIVAKNVEMEKEK